MVGAVVYAGAVVPNLKVAMKPGRLAPEGRARFEALDLGIATLSPADLGPVLLEPHASWMTRIAQDWASRYGVAQ